MPARETAARFPLPHGECGGWCGGQRPLPAIGFGVAARPPFFQKRAKRAGEPVPPPVGATPRARRVATRRAARLSVRRALRRSTRLYEVKGSVLPFISREAIV